MSEDQWIVLLFKIVLISGILSIVTWIAVYTRLAKWWRNAIGRTLVAKSLLLAGLLIPSALSLFFHLNRLTSHLAAWADVTLIGAITPVMIWRTAVWLRESRKGLPGPEGIGDGKDDG